MKKMSGPQMMSKAAMTKMMGKGGKKKGKRGKKA